MNMAQVFKLIQLLLAVGGNPLVQKFVDNMVAGTPTKVDDWVWKVLKAVALGGGSVNELQPALADVQRQYDQDPAAAKDALPEGSFVVA